MDLVKGCGADISVGSPAWRFTLAIIGGLTSPSPRLQIANVIASSQYCDVPPMIIVKTVLNAATLKPIATMRLLQNTFVSINKTPEFDRRIWFDHYRNRRRCGNRVSFAVSNWDFVIYFYVLRVTEER